MSLQDAVDLKLPVEIERVAKGDTSLRNFLNFRNADISNPFRIVDDNIILSCNGFPQ